VKKVNNTLYLFSSFIFNKLKFKGKGYYIYKNIRNTIAPQFGYYHRIYIYSYFNKVRFLSKTKVLLFGLTKEDVLHSSYGIKKKRPVNIFTGRGVRFAHQIIYKKTGKVSSYR
jgi:ribosomal protein L6P/L9E